MDVNLNPLPDIHVHPGASVSPHYLWELAPEQGIKPPEKNYWKFINLVRIKKTTSDKYLRKLNNSQKTPPLLNFHKLFNPPLLPSPFAIEKCVHYAISRAYRKSNVTLIEIRLNPLLRNKEEKYDIDKIILSACFGMQKAQVEYPVKAGLILETDRQFDLEKHWIIVKKAVKYKNLGIVGIDVSGPNPKHGFKIDDLVKPLNYAKEHRLKITFHTGEFTGPEEVWQVIEKINPERIGHGIQSWKDKSLLKELARRKTILEVCPGSNIKTQVIKGWKEIKEALKKFLEYSGE